MESVDKMTRKLFMKWRSSRFLSNMRSLAIKLLWLLLSFAIAAFIGAYAGSKWHGTFVEIAKFVLHDFWTLSVIIVCFLLVLCPYLPFFNKKKRFASKRNKEKSLPLYYDNPTDKDEFERKEYAKTLANKIIDSFQYQASLPKEEKADVSMVINIEEDYGFGKSSFLLLLKKCLDAESIISIDYRPWLCTSPDSIIVEFFQLLREKLKPYDNFLDKEIEKYIQGLLSSSSWTKPIADLVLSKSSLMHHHDVLRESIRDINIPIIVYIDDVDRLEKDELMTLLRLIRDTADFPNMFYILAADEGYLTNTLKEAGIKESSNYIKKFINYSFKLPADENAIEKILRRELQQVITTYLSGRKSCGAKDNKILKNEKEDHDGERISDIVEHILRIDNILDAFENPRDIYRLMNSYSFMLDSFKNSDRYLEVDCVDLFVLCLIQNLNPEVYEALRFDYRLLLDFSRDRFVLRKEYKSLFLTRDKERLLQGITGRNKVNNTEDNKENSKEENRPTRNYNNYKEIIAIERPTKDQITSSLLTYLFGDVINYRNSNRICLTDNYFTYFSAHKRSTEISTTECIFMMEQSNDDYKNRLDDLFKNKQEASFELRLPYVAERWKQDKIRILKRVFAYYDTKWKYNRYDFITFKSGQEYFSFTGTTELLSHVIFRLYHSSYLGKNEGYLNELREELLELYKTDNHYDFLLSVLGYIREEGNPLLKPGFFDNLLNVLIERLMEHLKEQDIASESDFYTINHFTELSFSYYIWRELFLDYLCKKDNYIVWFYKIFAFDSNGKIIYNDRIKHAMLPNDGSYYIDGLLKQHDDEKLNDLKTLVNIRQDIDSLSTSEHPFIAGLDNYLKSQQQKIG